MGVVVYYAEQVPVI